MCGGRRKKSGRGWDVRRHHTQSPTEGRKPSTAFTTYKKLGEYPVIVTGYSVPSAKLPVTGSAWTSPRKSKSKSRSLYFATAARGSACHADTIAPRTGAPVARSVTDPVSNKVSPPVLWSRSDRS